MSTGRLWIAAVLVALVALICAAGCTQHRTVPKEKAPCATDCLRGQSSCVNLCADPKQNIEVLEDIRGSLCEKRCKEDYEKCMTACL